MQKPWIKHLPDVRGKYTYNTVLAQFAWFGVGGVADVVFKPADALDLELFLKKVPSYVPLYVFGVGSNLLVRDGGVRGVVIRLGRGFNYIQSSKDEIIVGAATLDYNLALFAADKGLSGVEFLSSIPGTIGGALRMNAGCYGSEIKDVLVWAKAIDLNGNIHTIKSEDMKFGYRSCGVEPTWIFVEACVKGNPSTAKVVSEKINDFLKRREESQPLKTKTGGSTFRNPENMRAWELIDKVGFRGKRLNGAMVSEKHCNFLINTGDASAADLEQLGENVRQKVHDNYNITLRWEVVRLGEYKPHKMVKVNGFIENTQKTDSE